MIHQWCTWRLDNGDRLYWHQHELELELLVIWEHQSFSRGAAGWRATPAVLVGAGGPRLVRWAECSTRADTLSS
jgi:hypothetical protein